MSRMIQEELRDGSRLNIKPTKILKFCKENLDDFLIKVLFEG